jgi:hypothetical protein
MIMLYDPNLGIINLGTFNNTRQLKQEMHAFFSIYSEAYLNELVNNHLSRFSNGTDPYRLHKWQWRQKKLNYYLKHPSTTMGRKDQADMVLYFYKTSLTETNLNSTAIEMPSVKFFDKKNKLDINKTISINYFNHYDYLKRKNLWSMIK